MISNVTISTFSFANGDQLEDSKNLEILLKSLGISSDGNDNGATITEDGAGNFIFNTKKLTSILAGTAAGHAVEYAQFNTGLGTKISSSEKAVANGVATLGADGKLPTSQIPAIAISSTTVVADLAARLALAGSVQEGDFAKQTDANKTFILSSAGDGSVDGHWVEITATSDIVSINGYASGVIVLNTDDIAEGATNKYYTVTRFNDALATKSTDDLAEGATNKYFSAAAAVIALTEETLTNSEGAVIAAGKICRLVAGAAHLAIAADAMSAGTRFRVVKDATIADTASGKFYKDGAVIPATGLTQDAPIYLSKAVDGGMTQDISAFVAGDRVVILGKAISATSWEFRPAYKYLLV